MALRGEVKRIAKQIRTRGNNHWNLNPLRDAMICYLIDRMDWDNSEVAKRYGLTETRINQILRDNHAFLPIDKEYEKKKQVRRIKRQIKEKPTSLKDSLDWEKLLIDSLNDGKLIDGSTHQHITVILDSDAAIPAEQTTDNLLQRS
jgi:hypothetical protein